MKNRNRSTGNVGFVLCSALAAALTGCTTYVEHRHAHTGYAPPPAPPVAVTPPVVTPVIEIHTETDFYEPLSPHGEWVVVGSYGRCWRPTRVAVGWRPYCDGHWQRTDAGWYWASDEPWGWATYHYGRWDWSVDLGWIWLPHTQWAPAWVAWRHGGGYVGWAPLPPSARIGARGVMEIREPASAHRAFVFVSEQRLLEPVRPTTVIVNNTTVINQTVNITKIQEVNHTVINEGPRPEIIERKSGRKVQSLPVREMRHKEETETVARFRHLPARPEKAEPPAIATEAAPLQKVPSRELRPVEKTAGDTKAQPSNRNEVRRSAPAPARPAVERPARNEARRAGEIEKVRPQTAPAEVQATPEAKSANPVLPHETRQIEKPTETPRRPQPRAEKVDTHETGELKSSGRPARPEPQRRPGNERQRELERVKGKPETLRQSIAPTKPTSPSTNSVVEKRKRPEKPAGNKQGEARNKEKKGEEKEAPPQAPGVPPRSPQ